MKRVTERYWFVLVLAALILAAWFRPGPLKSFTDLLEPRLTIGAALFLMAAGLETRYTLKTLRRPWPALWAAVIGYCFLPATGWWTAAMLGNVDLRFGVLIITSVPCTLASAVLWTRMARGDEAVALLAVLLTTALSWLATTLWLQVAVQHDLSLNTLDMMQGLFLVLIVPVSTGQLWRALNWVRTAVVAHRWFLDVVARLLVLSIILKSLVGVFEDKDELGRGLAPGLLACTAGLCVGLHLAALIAGAWSANLLGFDRGEQVAVAFACSQKTLPVGLYLYETYFKESHPLAIVPLVCYHVGQLVTDTLIADLFTRRGQQTDPQMASIDL
jgi:sodium/bile acid cotransporter 7